MMFDFIIGLGQGGLRLGKLFAETFDCDAAYMNLSRVDFSKAGVPKNRIWVVDAGGSGRDMHYAEAIIKERQQDYMNFLEGIGKFVAGECVCVTVGGGGGSGCGMLIEVLRYLTKWKKVLVIYTLPQRGEGLRVKANALTRMNDLIARFLPRTVKRRISLLMVDNEYCRRYGDEWDRINMGIVKSLYRFDRMASMGDYHNYVTPVDKSLDRNDIRRLLFSHGIIDIRQVIFEDFASHVDYKNRVVSASLVSPNLDMRTAQGYVVSVGMPDYWQNSGGGKEFYDYVYDTTTKMTRNAPDVLRCAYYNKKIDNAHVHLLISGLTRSKGLERMVRWTERDLEKMESRPDVEALDLKKISHNIGN